MPVDARIVRDETVRVRVVVSIGPFDGDRKRYGRCIVCREPFADEDQVHMVGSVVRNGRTVGNRLGCTTCAGRYASYHRLFQSIKVSDG